MRRNISKLIHLPTGMMWCPSDATTEEITRSCSEIELYVKSKGYDSVIIEFCEEYGCVESYVYGKRKETDEEYYGRLEREQLAKVAYEARKVESEKKLLAELKEKYEPSKH
ncbi:hypothetical protein [Vibrio phage vB_VpaP_SJSY21]|nr:hypothetical protein [Vibrio phage vB_VpaP_SJSY21]